MSLTFDVAAIGLSLPGLANLAAARLVLLGQGAYQPSDTPPTASALLPANERRRAPLAVRLAFAAAEDAMQGHDPAEWATVFASSDADTPIIHRICSALDSPQRMVSPTDFHNCVHNAAAGYWSIAARCSLPSSSISAYDHSFTAGLLEAASLCMAEARPVLLVAYDIPPPAPLYATRPITLPAAIALALCPAGTGAALATLKLAASAAVATSCIDPALEALRLGNPAARGLPLVQLLLNGAAQVQLDGWSLSRC